jgi:alpha-tubulin suppressor-like RCC1 family protein
VLSLLVVVECGADVGSSATLETGTEMIVSRGTGRWMSVGAGNDHACALMTEGEAFCWRAGSGTPRRVLDAPALATITVGSARSCDEASVRTCEDVKSMHACGLDKEGLAYCWGDNVDGQLGDGTTVDRESAAPAAAGLRFRSISAGSAFTCAVSTDNVAYCWGFNGKGNLARGSVDESTHPLPRPIGRGVLSVAAGVDFACALDLEGNPFCWGDDHRARLGSAAAPSAGPATTPVPVNGTHRFASLSAGRAHACGLTSSGGALCWGSNADQELGSPLELPSAQRDPVEVAAPPLKAVSAGTGAHTCGIARDDAAWCWGDNRHGQVGRGDGAMEKCATEPCPSNPSRVAGGARFRAIATGNDFTCGVTQSGELLCWGGRAAAGGSSDIDVPTRVRDPERR